MITELWQAGLKAVETCRMVSDGLARTNGMDKNGLDPVVLTTKYARG